MRGTRLFCSICWLTLGAAIILGGIPLIDTASRCAAHQARAADSAAEKKPASPAPEGYSLGISCVPVGSTLSAQLGLEPGQGVIVIDVRAGGPGEKAGLAAHDVVTQLDGRTITGATAELGDTAAVETLRRRINEVGERSVEITILRQGKPVKLQITPQPRVATQPEPPQDALATAPPHFLESLKWLQSQQAGPGRLAVQLIRPGAGVITGDNVMFRPALPDDVTVSIRRRGKQPAEVTVERGSEKWTLKEAELGKLPAELQQVVEPLVLGAAPAMLHLSGAGPTSVGLPPGAAPFSVRLPGPPPGTGDNAAIENKLEQLNKQMAEMQSAIQSLKTTPPAKSDDSAPKSGDQETP